MPVKWTQDLATGIELIDQQHRQIIDYINTLEEAIAEQNRETVSMVLDQLLAYTESHFTLEESLMEDVRYPFLNGHRKIHQSFIAKVKDHIERFHRGEDVAEALRKQLELWLVNHIKTVDSDYARDLKSEITQAVKEKDKSNPGWLRRFIAGAGREKSSG